MPASMMCFIATHMGPTLWRATRTSLATLSYRNSLALFNYHLRMMTGMLPPVDCTREFSRRVHPLGLSTSGRPRK